MDVRALVLVGAALAVLAMRPASSSAAPRRILAVGDSITADGRYAAQAAALLQAQAVAAVGWPGRGAAVVRGELPGLLADHRPTDLVVLVGVNDLASGRTAAAIAADLAAIYRTARGAGVRVWPVDVLPWAGWLAGARFDGRRARIAAEGRLLSAWIRRQSGATPTASLGDAAGRLLWTGDGLHPDALGHRALGALIANTIERS